MGLTELLVAAISLTVGVLVTVMVSRHYFKLTVDRELTPYAHDFSSLFAGVDPSVRESLKVAYKGTAVDELLDVQFLIANTGRRAIRDVLSPLTLKMPERCELLDVSVLYVSPDGRDVVVEKSEGAASFVFPVLNAGEFFIAKLLIRGVASLSDFKFTITVDDLPPILSCERLPIELMQGERKREFAKEPLIVGAILLLISCAIATLVYQSFDTVSQVWSVGLSEASIFPLLIAVAVIMSALFCAFTLILGVMLFALAFGDFSFPRKKGFKIPSHFHRPRLRIDNLSG